MGRRNRNARQNPKQEQVERIVDEYATRAGMTRSKRNRWELAKTKPRSKQSTRKSRKSSG